MHACIYPFIHASYHLFSYLIVPSSIHPSYPSIHLSIRPSFYSSFHPPILLSFHPSIHSFIHPSIHLSFHLSIHPSNHPPIHSFMYACMQACSTTIVFHCLSIYGVPTGRPKIYPSETSDWLSINRFYFKIQ